MIATARLSVATTMTAMILAFASTSFGSDVVLTNGNTVARFRTESSDIGTKGLYDLEVDGVDQVNQIAYWFRVGDGVEQRIDTLNHVSTTSADLGSFSYLESKYDDPSGDYEATINFFVTGDTTGSKQANFNERIRIKNTSAADLEFHLFQYVDFDVSGTSLGDTVHVAGMPENTATQTDSLFTTDSFSTPPPTRFEVSEVGVGGDILSRLGDGSSTDLSNFSGPLVNLNGAWAFQWDLVIAPGNSMLVDTATSIRPVPEPGTALLAILGLTGLTASSRRRKR